MVVACPRRRSSRLHTARTSALMNPTSANFRSSWEDADRCSRNSDGPLLACAELALVRLFLPGETAALRTQPRMAVPGCCPPTPPTGTLSQLPAAGPRRGRGAPHMRGLLSLVEFCPPSPTRLRPCDRAARLAGAPQAPHPGLVPPSADSGELAPGPHPRNKLTQRPLYTRSGASALCPLPSGSQQAGLGPLAHSGSLPLSEPPDDPGDCEGQRRRWHRSRPGKAGMEGP